MDHVPAYKYNGANVLVNNCDLALGKGTLKHKYSLIFPIILQFSVFQSIKKIEGFGYIMFSKIFMVCV